MAQSPSAQAQRSSKRWSWPRWAKTQCLSSSRSPRTMASTDPEVLGGEHGGEHGEMTVKQWWNECEPGEFPLFFLFFGEKGKVYIRSYGGSAKWSTIPVNWLVKVQKRLSTLHKFVSGQESSKGVLFEDTNVRVMIFKKRLVRAFNPIYQNVISCYRFEHICMRMCTWQSIQIHRRDNPKRKTFRNSPPRLQLQHLFVGTLGTFWRNQPRDTSLENPPTKISARKLCVCVRENTYNLVQNLSIPSWVCTCSYNLIGSKRMEMLTRSYKPIRETLGCH